MATETMFLKVTKTLGDNHQDLIISLEASPDGSYSLNKVIFWQVDLETGKGAWTVMPLGANPDYEEGMKDEVTAEIQRARAVNEAQNPEYQKLIEEIDKEWILQDEY